MKVRIEMSDRVFSSSSSTTTYSITPITVDFLDFNLTPALDTMSDYAPYPEPPSKKRNDVAIELISGSVGGASQVLIGQVSVGDFHQSNHLGPQYVPY